MRPQPHRSPLREYRRLRIAVLLAGFILLGGTATLRAQAADKWIEKGNAAFAKQSYTEAIEFYEWAKNKKGGARAYEGLGRCWWELKHYDKAETYFRLATEEPDASPMDFFYLGRALLANEKYQAASDAFTHYRSLSPDQPNDEFAALGQVLPTLLGDSSGFRLRKLPFNSRSSDFSPAYFDKGLLFTSSRQNQNSIVRTSNVDGLPLTDLWYVEQLGTDNWGKPEPFSQLNSRVNEGPLCVDTLRKLIYFTRNDPQLSRFTREAGRANKLAIHIAGKGENGWEPRGPLSLGDPAGTMGHPTISADGNRLIFAADFKGGLGGSDLYVCERNGDQWSAPRNLGPAINTAGDELFPFLSPEGTLHFSSDGRIGLGGLDIFYARASGNGWLAPVNAGYPLNSHADDFGYISQDGGKSGFISSNRDAEPNDDNIFSFHRLRPQFSCTPQEENNYCFRFEDQGGYDLTADTVPLLLEWNLGDGTRVLTDIAEHCYEKPGLYTVELNLVDTVTGFIFLNQATYEVNVTDIEQVYIEGPDTVVAGRTVEYHGLKSVVPDCQMGKLYWEFSDGRRANGERVQHSFSAPGVYRVQLGIEGDSLGSSRRCLSCVYREILVLPEERFRQIRDSVGYAREQNLFRLQNDRVYQDSLRRAREVLRTVQAIRDSLEKVFRLQLRQSDEPIDPKSLNFKGGEVDELRVADRYVYTTGEEDKAENLYRTFRMAHEQGFDESIVVAFQGDVPISRADPGRMVRLPARISPKGVTVFKGEIVDSKGRPLAAEINLEDLARGLRIVRARADEQGKFRLELPNGEIYGYFIDLPNYYPVSDLIDLRNRKIAGGQPEIVISKEITLLTVQEIFEQGISVRINNVFFDFDSSDILPESRTELDRLGRLLVENPDLNVDIMGHTDAVGEVAYNLRLSRNRARAVANYLVLSGYPLNKVSHRGYGESNPIAPNDSPEGRRLNRRVEFRLVPSRKGAG